MPVFTIQAPDGREIDIEAADEATAMRGAQQWAASNPAKPAKDARRTSQSLGFMKGVARPLENFSKVDPLNVFDTRKSRETREKARVGMHNYFAKREETERPGIIGEVAGNIVGTAPVLAVTRNPFAAGALQGAALTDAKDVKGVASDAAIGGALGWAGGKVVDAVADVIKPAIGPSVRRLQQAGVKLTPGMVKGGKAMVREDKMMSRPFVGDRIAEGRRVTLESANVARVNQALKPLGVKAPASVSAGFDAIGFAKTQVKKAYDTVVPNMAVSLNGQQFIAKIGPSAATLEPAQGEQLRKLLSANLKNGQLAGKALQNAQREIRRQARGYSVSDKWAEQELGRVLWEVDDELSAAMVAQNPKWAPQFQKANEAYKGYRIVADAASRADEGVASTAQFRDAVRRGDRTKNKDAMARGAAFMQRHARDERRVIPAKTPDSGTAGRQQAGNIFAQAKGAVDALGYSIDEGVQALRLMPRPSGARKAARGVRRLRGPAAGAAATVAAHRSGE